MIYAANDLMGIKNLKKVSDKDKKMVFFINS